MNGTRSSPSFSLKKTVQQWACLRVTVQQSIQPHKKDHGAASFTFLKCRRVEDVVMFFHQRKSFGQRAIVMPVFLQEAAQFIGDHHGHIVTALDAHLNNQGMERRFCFGAMRRFRAHGMVGRYMEARYGSGSFYRCKAGFRVPSVSSAGSRLQPFGPGKRGSW